MYKQLILGISLVALGAVSLAQESTQTYEVTLESNWNARDHLSVPGSAHFSPVVAVSHTSDFDLVTLGGKTSTALEPLAELGQTGEIEKEIAMAQSNTSVLESVVTENMFVIQQATQKFTIVIDQSHPFLSLVTMIAPSPDWVLSVSNMKLFSVDQGFLEGVTQMPLFAIDAGTEEGDFAGNFSINNSASSPIKTVNVLNGNGFNAPFAYLSIKKL